MSQRVTADSWGRAVHDHIRGMSHAIEVAAVETCAQATGELVARTDAAGLVDEGEYRNGWSFQRITGGAEVGNDAPHADAIEHGRRPYRPGPPIEPIRRWVERKLQPPADQLEQIAWRVRNAIHRRGSPPRLIFASYQPRLKQLFEANLRRRLRR